MTDPAEDQVREQLERVLRSQEFQSSDRLCRFLRFTVDARLRGDQEQVKEYLIGREVFDRNGEYDPRIDPIVRVEARRLRRKLDEYYAGAGASDPVRITFPKGSYVPAFGSAAEPEGPAAELPTRRSWLIPAASAAAAAAAIATGVFYYNRTPAPPSANSLAVIPARWIWRNEDFSNALHDEDLAERVAAELATRHGMSVIAWPSMQKYRSNSPDAKQLAEQLGVSRLLIVTVRVEATGQRATAFLVDAKSDRKLGVSDRSGLDLSSPEARGKAAAEMAKAVAALPVPK